MLSLCVKLMSTNDAALLTAKCSEYEEDIDYTRGKYTVDAKSLMGVLSVGLGNECCITLHSDDPDVCRIFEEDMSLWRKASKNDGYCCVGREVPVQ